MLCAVTVHIAVCCAVLCCAVLSKCCVLSFNTLETFRISFFILFPRQSTKRGKAREEIGRAGPAYLKLERLYVWSPPAFHASLAECSGLFSKFKDAYLL